MLWRILFVSPAAAIMAAAGFAAFLILGSWWLRKKPDSSRGALKLLIGAWVFLVLIATIYPEQSIGSSHEPINWNPGEQFSAPLVDQFELDLLVRQYIGNAAMFAPLGALGWLISRRFIITFGACVGLSVAIEAVQQIMGAGRSADIDDVLCNSGGALAGVALAVAAWMISGVFGKSDIEGGANLRRASIRRISR